jgi:YD repeat-containing protein
MKTKNIVTILALLISNVIFSQIKHTYQYDTEGLLVHTKDGVKTQEYQYDKLGNRLGYKITSVVSLADLSISAVNSSFSIFTQGQQTTITGTLNNTGAVIAQSSILKVYLSTTTTGTEIEVGSIVVPIINAGASTDVNVTVNIPNNATLGTQYLVYYIDAISTIQETDESNNKNNIAITVNAPDIAELSIQNATIGNASVIAGANLTLTANIYNTGSLNASSVSVKSYVSSNTTLEANDTELQDANETITVLNAGANLAYNKTVVIPTNTIAGTYYVLFVVDKYNAVSELDETNNVVAVALSVIADTVLPSSNFIADNQVITTTASVQFTDQSTNTPTSWLWSFPGGTPSTSTAQNPSILYNTTGIYDVTLQVFNSNGTNQEYKNEYITVTTNTSELTHVPDDNFEQALIDFGYDTGALDDYVPTANIASVTSLDISSKSIIDLTGIEDFQALRILNVANNQITTISLIENKTLLEEFNCASNSLTTLDVSSNTNLIKLDANTNQLTTLDLSTNTKLTSVLLNNNALESLNIKNTTNSIIIIIIIEFNVLNNTTNLCIQVDNATNATSGVGSYATWQKDVSAQYSESCAALSILQDELISSILVYPNPTKAFLKIQINNNLVVTNVYIYNSLGKELLRISNDFDNIDISKFASGVYFLKIKTDKGAITQKVIKK